jgi:glycosyltransferase involved in cell wall biosynthesis
VDAVIPNGVDTNLFAPGTRLQARDRLGLDSSERFALFVGRFEHRKGADVVPEACRKAGFTLLVAGSGAPSSARSLGVLSPADLAHAYRAADCVVLPSRYEACSFLGYPPAHDLGGLDARLPASMPRVLALHRAH